jgi:hypothetical protein
VWSFKDDHSFWVKNEKLIIGYLESLWYKIERNNKTDIHDWRITKGWATVNVELKTRRCNYNDYEDTLIWANKLWEAWNKYYLNWECTLFFFSYTDWLFYVNPLETLPNKIEYKKFRWDRWEFDKPKWWLLYHIDSLTRIL